MKKTSLYEDEGKKETKPPQQHKIAFVGPGQLLGEEDVLSHNRPYTTSLTCKSNHAELFCIKADEFLRKMKSNSESWKTVILMALAK